MGLVGWEKHGDCSLNSDLHVKGSKYAVYFPADKESWIAQQLPVSIKVDSLSALAFYLTSKTGGAPTCLKARLVYNDETYTDHELQASLLRLLFKRRAIAPTATKWIEQIILVHEATYTADAYLGAVTIDWA